MKRTAAQVSHDEPQGGGASAAVLAAQAAAQAAAAMRDPVPYNRRRQREWYDDVDSQGQAASRARGAPVAIPSTYHYQTFEDEYLARHVDQLYQLGLLDEDKPLPRTWRALCGRDKILSGTHQQEAAGYDADTTIPFADPNNGLAIAPSDAVLLSDGRCYSRANARKLVEDAYWRREAVPVSAEDLRVLQLDNFIA